MKAILVGCGSQAPYWVAGVPAGVEVAGFVDLDLAAAERQAAGTDAAVGTDLLAMLRAVRPEVVFDCTIPSAHPEVTITALRAGCHVLGEKPMAETHADARRMLAAAEESGRIYAVNQGYRYEIGARRLRQMLPDLGTVTALHSDFFVAPRFGGFREQMEHPLLVDMAIHTFDTARFLLGADAVSVYCHAWNPAGSWYAGAASAVCVFEMTDGAVYTYRGSWCAHGMTTGWNGSWRAIGDSGTAVWDGANGLFGETVAATEGQVSIVRSIEAPPPVDDHDDMRAVLAEFVACVNAGTEPQTVCTDNVKSLAMVLGAVESARTGARVTIDA